tara:strand:+ start:17 stop:316 length:300 start_codon:yes stop_codon:yes gene_type:complete
MRLTIKIVPVVWRSGVRYEAYSVDTRSSWWRGVTTTLKQIYFDVTEGQEKEISEGSFRKWESPNNQDYYKSQPSVEKMVKLLDKCYGVSYSLLPWRPEL